MRSLRSWFMPLSLAVIVSAALLVPLPLFLESPGDPVSLGEAVEVGVEDPDELSGDFLLTAVNVRRATATGVLRAMVDSQVSLVAARRIVPPGEDDAVYFDRQREVFRESVSTAAAVGLSAAGFPVDTESVTGSGVVVMRVLEQSPADGVLQPGDVIVGVDGAPVRVADDLRGLIGTSDDGRPREVAVRRDGEERTVTVVPGEFAVGDGRVTHGLGVEIQTLDQRVELPVPVDVDSGRIGGPSAGLMMALTVYDKASHDVDLAAGRTIAGTGMLSLQGEVGPIGGIAGKVVAAERRDVDVFLSPASQLDVARDAVPEESDLEIVGVATFEEAVDVLTGELQATGGRALV